MDTGLRVFDERYKGNVADPLFRKEYFNIFMSEWAEHDRLKTARLDGKAEGKAEGNRQFLVAMFEANIPSEQIFLTAQTVGLSKDEVQREYDVWKARKK
ncbi:hypothetical protein FACS18949_14130 [Clostridia bacterium]|nr:hypothetical protein FACS18949_14130 [Clostridia bacterium]